MDGKPTGVTAYEIAVVVVWSSSGTAATETAWVEVVGEAVDLSTELDDASCCASLLVTVDAMTDEGVVRVRTDELEGAETELDCTAAAIDDRLEDGPSIVDETSCCKLEEEMVDIDELEMTDVAASVATDTALDAKKFDEANGPAARVTVLTLAAVT